MIASAVLARMPATPPRIALLTVSTDPAMQGRPVLTFYTIDAARRALRPVPWQGDTKSDTSVAVPLPDEAAYGAHLLCALPAHEGGGLVVFCEHSVWHVSPPAHVARRARPAVKRARGASPSLQHTPHPSGQVIAACFLATGRVLYATAAGSLYALTCPTEARSMCVDSIATALPVAAGPHALAPLDDDLVVLASATGPSLVGLIDTTWHTLHTWPHAGPVLDLAIATPAAGPAAPPCLLRACGASPSYALQLLSHALPTRTRAEVSAPGCVDVYACHDTTLASPSTLALVVVYPHEAHIYDTTLLLRRTVPGRVVYAAGVQGALLVVTRTHIEWSDAPAWVPEAEIVAAYATTEQVLVGLHGQRVVLLRATQGVGLIVVQTQDVSADVACVWLGSEALVGLWDATVVQLSVPTLAATRTWAPAAMSVASSLGMYAPGLVVGTVDGRVLVWEGEELVHTLQLRGSRVRCEPCALGALGLPGTGLLVSSGDDAGLLYQKAGQWAFSPWPVRAVQALVRVYEPTEPLSCVVLADAQLSWHSVRGVQQDHVTTAALCAVAPQAMALAPTHAVVALWDEEQACGQVALFDRATLERGAALTLSARERPESVHVILDGDQTNVVTGTSYQVAAAAVPTAGRLVMAQLDGEKLVMLGALDVPGRVLGVAYVQGYVVAAVDAQVHTYAWDADTRCLKLCARWGCAFMASCLAAHDTTVVVGDAMHSLTVLQVEADGALRQVARDLDPYWTTAVGVYNASTQEYVGADIAMNVFVAQRLALSATAGEPWSHVMRRTTAFQYGDMVNRLVRAGDGCVYVGAAAGGVGMLMDLTPGDAAVLTCLQQALSEAVLTLDRVPWATWRTLRTETREAPPLGVVDAELVRAFFACDAPQRAHILKEARGLAGDDVACRAALDETSLRSLLSRLP